MSKILILHSSQEGQTTRIANKMATVLQQEAHTVSVMPVANQPNPIFYDGVIIGASIHMGQYQPEVKAYITKNMTTLANLPTAFYSVCLSIAEDKEEKQHEAIGYMQELIIETGWKPEMVKAFAGAVKYTHYGFLKRWFMKRLAQSASFGTDVNRNYEYTDWQAVTDFAHRFARLLRGTEQAAAMYAA